MLLITHDLGIVRKMAERVYIMQGGKIVEEGATEDIFTKPQHGYTKQLLAAEPKGDPPAANDAAPVVVETDDLKVWFPIKRGRAAPHRRLRQGGGRAVAQAAQGADARRRRRIRLRQDHARPRHPAARSPRKGPIVYVGKRIDGLSSREMRPLRKEMQIVFQDPFGSLSPRMSVNQIIGEGLTIQAPELDYDQRRVRISAALKEVGLDPTAQDRYPHEFSGGQRQRIAIARAMVLQPKFVMLDEPTSALDMSVQAQIVDLLRELQRKRDLAYLFISHDLKVIRALCNYVIVMRNGKVVEEGPAAEVFSNPKEEYTKALLAAAFNISVLHKNALAG